MRTLARAVVSLLGDPRRLVTALRGLQPFLANWREFTRLQEGAPATLRPRLRNLYPCLTDRYESAGTARGHYFHQDVWVARRIYEAAPEDHYDIGSRIDGFVGHLLAFREVHVLDVRHLETTQPGLHFTRANLLDLPFSDGSVASISSLHAVEHVGLGRYGDLVMPDGCFRAIRELQRVVAVGGRLYFSVPIGVERLEFNAHRIFAPATVLEQFRDLELVEFAAVDDNGDLVEGVHPDRFARSRYACGMFVFERPAAPRATAPE